MPQDPELNKMIDTLLRIKLTIERTTNAIHRDQKTELVIQSIRIANAVINRPTAPDTQQGD